MSNANDAKSQNSDGTSSKPPANDPHAEPEPLARQFSEAKAILLDNLRAAHDELQAAPDLASWTREHPWMAVAAAAASGITAAGVVRPEQMAAAVDRLFDKPIDATECAAPQEPGEGAANNPHPATSGGRADEPVSAVVTSLLEQFTSRLGSLLQSSLKPKTPSPKNSAASDVS